MERRTVKYEREKVLMTNILADENSVNNEVFRRVLEAMSLNEIVGKRTLLQNQLHLIQEEPDRERTRMVLEILLPADVPPVTR